jgi:hypothetical protein
MSQLLSSSSLNKFQASSDATRYFCSVCSSFVCMEYHHERQTLWIPMGTIEQFSPDLVDKVRDSHIFKQDEASYGSVLEQLGHYEGFGTYRSDNCCGKPWDELKSSDEI